MPVGQKYRCIYLHCNQTIFKNFACLSALDVKMEKWDNMGHQVCFCLQLSSCFSSSANIELRTPYRKRSSTNICCVPCRKGFFKRFLFLFSLYMLEQRAPIHFWLVLKSASYRLSPFMFCTLCSALFLPEYLLHGRGTQIL